MKRFFTKNGILLLTAVTIVAVVLCVVSAVSSGTGFLANAAGVVASPFRSAGAAVSGWVQGIGDHFQSIASLQQETEALRQENARLQEAIRQAQADSEENARLRNVLNLRRQRRDLTLESAYITARSTSNWASTLTLSKGTASGVAPGNCVVDEYGSVVGIITDAGLNWSTVTTLVDVESRLGATVFRTDETAIASGELRLMSAGRLRLNYIQGELLNGDLIVTSGLGGYYPPDLVIGTVEEVLTDDSGMGQYAILLPKAQLDALAQVFVITGFDIVE